MKTYEWDILIVGAGPAGSSAALAACRKGSRVLVVERKEVAGRPVRCAEYIPAPLLGEVNLGRGFVVQSVQGMLTHLPSGEIKETLAPGFTIRRDIFDQTLVRKAKEVGAKIWLSSRVLGRDEDGVLVRKGETLARIKAKVIIGADGTHSSIGRWIRSVNQNMIPAIQVRLPLSRPMEYTEVYFDRDIYGGYGWLFPKGGEANVGIGLKQRKERPERMRGILDRLITRLAEEGKIKGEILEYIAGWIPAERPRRITRENIMLAGDAAGQTHAISGAGVSQAIICGRMAGRWAARAVEKGDIGLLTEYEKEWLELYGETQERAFNRRQLLEREWGRLDEIIKYCWIAFREYYVQS